MAALPMLFTLRKAVFADVPALRELIEVSVRELQAQDYTPEQIEGALTSVYGVDSQLIADGSYFTVETRASGGENLLVGCGGWSKRKTLFGGDQYRSREPELLDPARDAAKIRAFFVHPKWARRGIGTMILRACEEAAVAAGFRHLEMGATLTGVPFYKAAGYYETRRIEVALGNGASLRIACMEKKLLPDR
jgi:GNAT superfamily N-acetyltransferase